MSRIQDESLVVKIDGEINETIYNHIISLEITEDTTAASTLSLRLGVTRCHPDNSWSILDDGDIELWKPITVEAGFADETEEIFSGFVTHLKPNFDVDPSKCTLDVAAIDRSIILDREQKLRPWANKKDSDIAREILATEYGLAAEITDTPVEHDEAVTTVTQRETDMRFLQRLARRNGFEVYINGTDAYFGPPVYDDNIQPTLSVHFGAETTLTNFDLDVNGLSNTRVETASTSRDDRSDSESPVESSEEPTLGGEGAADLDSGEVPDSVIFLGSSAVASQQELEMRAQAIYNRQQWFITGSGEVAGNFYGHVIRAHKMVTIKGIGEAYSGNYYVTQVTHRFGVGGYRMQIRVRRNATVPAGDENFETGDSSLLSVM